jgi:hypothetical protein
MLQGEFFQNPGGASDFYSHQINQSVRFTPNGSSLDSTTYLSRTQGTPTNADKMTVSFWVKRGALGARQYGMTGSGYSSGGGQYSQIMFGGDGNDADKFYWLQNPQNSSGAGGTSLVLESNALFRDTGGWMNIVLSNDSTQATDTNRNKIYINGIQLTSWGTGFTASFYSVQNSDFLMNSSGHKIFVGSAGASAANAYNPFDGYIAEYVFIDGTQYDVSNFGETKNSVWVPKDVSGLTFGNNGFYLRFEDSSDLGNDSSGNNNDLTSTGLSAYHQVLDSPTFSSGS